MHNAVQHLDKEHMFSFLLQCRNIHRMPSSRFFPVNAQRKRVGAFSCPSLHSARCDLKNQKIKYLKCYVDARRFRGLKPGGIPYTLYMFVFPFLVFVQGHRFHNVAVANSCLWLR